MDEKTTQSLAAQALAASSQAAATVTIISHDLSYIKDDIKDIKSSLKDVSDQFVTRAEFAPVKAIVFGMIGILGIATIGAILKLVFIR